MALVARSLHCAARRARMRREREGRAAPVGMTCLGETSGGRGTQDPGAKPVPGAPVTQEKETQAEIREPQDPPSQNEGGAPTTQEKAPA